MLPEMGDSTLWAGVAALARLVRLRPGRLPRPLTGMGMKSEAKTDATTMRNFAPNLRYKGIDPLPLGDGKASERIVALL